jgi:hypothetical protein
MPRFVGQVETPDGGSSAYVRLPADVVSSLGPAKRPPVVVTLNGYTYRTTVALYGGQSLLGVRREIRDAAGIAFDEPIEISVEVDTAERTVDVPPPLVDAFDAEPELRRAFERLSYTERKELVESIVNAKREETRHTRLARAIERLRQP